MLISTPIARTEAAALSRIVFAVSKGSSRYTSGTISADKAEYLANKFHRLHGIAATPSQRYTRKRKGLANGTLVMYWPEEAKTVHWLLLFTDGELNSHEKLRHVEVKPRLQWIRYELYRYTMKGRLSWSFKRPKGDMEALVGLLHELLNKRQHNAVERLLEQAAKQPGFRGVRNQTWELTQIAKKHGYSRELPFLFYIQKISHGDRLVLQ